jgi:hypothetical protein
MVGSGQINQIVPERERSTLGAMPISTARLVQGAENVGTATTSLRSR